jgi:hypothetical protein
MATENWKDEPEAEDYPAAQSYLSLLVGAETAAKLVKPLRKEKGLASFAAKDILRASGFPRFAVVGGGRVTTASVRVTT